MASAFAGKYRHVKNENVEEYFRSIGVTDDAMSKIGKLAPVLEIVVDGNKVTIKGRTDVTFEIGKEFNDPMVTGDILKSTAALDGNKIVISSVDQSGRKGSRTFELTSDELVIHLVADGSSVVGKRFYNKI